MFIETLPSKILRLPGKLENNCCQKNTTKTARRISDTKFKKPIKICL